MERKTKAISISGLTEEKIELVKRTVCKDASDDELQLFLHVCQKCGLDPFMKQIYAIKRNSKSGPVMTIQTSVDGMRLVADRSGKYSPGRESTFVYDEKKNLISATAYIKKMTPDGTWHEVSSTAFLSEYKPKTTYPNKFWDEMPHVMLAKCAESAALRKAFPAEMSGIYTEEEMAQATPPEETLTFEQCEEVIELVGGDEDLLERILKGYKVKKLSEIKASNYAPLLNNLQKRKQQVAV